MIVDNFLDEWERDFGRSYLSDGISQKWTNLIYDTCRTENFLYDAFQDLLGSPKSLSLNVLVKK